MNKLGFGKNLLANSMTRILKIKNKHQGSRIFCLGNGPSLKNTDLSLLKNEILIGTNYVNKVFQEYGFFPQYCCVTDRKRIIELREYHLLKKSTVIVSDNMSLLPNPTFFTPEERESYIFLQQMSKKVYLPFNLLIQPLVYGYYAAYSSIKRSRPLPTLLDIQERLVREVFADKDNFSFDLTKGVNTGSTVIFTAIQVAAYMGASEIYLLGVDADYSKEKYCFDVDESKFFTHSAFMNDPLKFMNPFFKIFNDQLNCKRIKLFNATIGGRLDSVQRKDFYSLF